MTTSTAGHNTDNVVDFFTGKPYSHPSNRRFIRLSPELDGLEMLYSNQAYPDKLFSIKVLCWGLRADGEVVGLVPWLDDIVPCPDIKDPLNGQWEGYYDPGIDESFTEPPLHKLVELEAAAEYYEFDTGKVQEIIQEIPDFIGTHAVLSGDGFKSLTLREVTSWRLHSDGEIQGMLIDDDKVTETPVLPGDDSLFPAMQHDDFRYYFQHHIANKIKARDPEAMAAISMLSET